MLMVLSIDETFLLSITKDLEKTLCVLLLAFSEPSCLPSFVCDTQQDPMISTIEEKETETMGYE
jgi:hypothetical protein